MFYPTLTVEEKKVWSDLHLVAFSKSYKHIEVLPIKPFLGYPLRGVLSKQKNGERSTGLPIIMKIGTLLFLHLVLTILKI